MRNFPETPTINQEQKNALDWCMKGADDISLTGMIEGFLHEAKDAGDSAGQALEFQIGLVPAHAKTAIVALQAVSDLSAVCLHIIGMESAGDDTVFHMHHESVSSLRDGSKSASHLIGAWVEEYINNALVDQFLL